MVAQTALEHQLCPHEFSLDLSLACDLVVCDYNYAFDPRVRLQRFFTQGKTPFALLLDEAHNLPARAREMYSEDLRAEPLEALRKAVPRGAARKLPAYLALRELCACWKPNLRGRKRPSRWRVRPASRCAARWRRWSACCRRGPIPVWGIWARFP